MVKLLAEKELYEFGPFFLDVRERTLRKHEEAIALTPKAFDTLVALVRNHGRVLGKDELLKLGPNQFDGGLDSS